MVNEVTLPISISDVSINHPLNKTTYLTCTTIYYEIPSISSLASFSREIHPYILLNRVKILCHQDICKRILDTISTKPKDGGLIGSQRRTIKIHINLQFCYRNAKTNIYPFCWKGHGNMATFNEFFTLPILFKSKQY